MKNLAIIISIILLFSCGKSQHNASQKIDVSGNSSIKSKPDIASITLSLNAPLKISS